MIETRIRVFFLFCLFVLSAGFTAAAQQSDSVVDGFVARSYHSPTGETMSYRLFVPPGYDAAKKYPIVLWLHGAAGRGSDNLKQISGGNFLGTHVWTTPENQVKYHAFVVAPQCDATKAWARPHAEGPAVSIRLALEILDTVEKEYSIDLDRVYVAGQSMGGEGTWAALASAPGRFAAAIPLCGYGFEEMIGAGAKTPVWIWQGDADEVVAVARARRWVAGLRDAGGTPKYTEVPGWGHNVWEKAFADPELLPWLFSKHRES
ncbi:MAG: alpha/beta hydrolase-fold protein [Candidatus Acidiferrales bacterium]